MKKAIVFVLMAALTLALCACGKAGIPGNGTEPDAAASETPQLRNEPEQNEPPAAEDRELAALLDSIEGHASIGAENDSTAAVQAAAKLMAWCTVTDLELEEVRAEAVRWLTDKGNDAQTAFAEKLRIIDDACKELIAQDSTELLESVGCGDCFYPWADVPYEKYIAIMETAGVR